MFKMYYIDIPQGVPVALFLINRGEVAKFLERQNQSVQLRLFMYVSHPCLMMSFRQKQALQK